MATRSWSRLLLNLYIAPQLLKRKLFGRKQPSQPKRILVIHQLLLGDTLMTASLLAKLREQHPQAHIATAIPEAFTPLFEGNPWNVQALPYSPYKLASLWQLLRQPRYDLALVPGDNRYGWVAFAMGCHWICGFDGDRPAYKSACFDELRPYSTTPAAWTDMVGELIDGPPPQPFLPSSWAAPVLSKPPEHTLPAAGYTLLHIGAKSPLKAWPTAYWQALIQTLQAQQQTIVISCGPGEAALIDALELPDSMAAYPGNLPLIHYWQLLANAKLLVCPDNGAAHLARIVGTATVCLFGPASTQIYGASEYWQSCAYQAVTVDVPCRDQHNVFKRELQWAQTCERSPQQCPKHICMPKLSVDSVLEAIAQLEHAR